METKKDKRVLTMFLLMVPSLVIAMSAAIDNFLVRISIQAILLFFQIVLVKNLLDDYQI